jgi:hypothetical protein
VAEIAARDGAAAAVAVAHRRGECHPPSPRSPIYCATADTDTPTIESGASRRGAVARQHLRRSVGLAADRSHAASSGCWDCSADTRRGISAGDAAPGDHRRR